MSDITYTAATGLPITLEEAKSHINVVHTADDTLIEGYIKAATALLEARSNRCFMAQTRVLKMDSFCDSRYVHRGKIYPPRSPLKSVTSLAYIDSDGISVTMPSSDYLVATNERPGYIAESYESVWPTVRLEPQSVTVTYIAGHSTSTTGIPFNVKLAIQQIVGYWYRNRESHAEKTFVELPMSVAALLESEHLETYG